jgi:hypothetical protein
LIPLYIESFLPTWSSGLPPLDATGLNRALRPAKGKLGEKAAVRNKPPLLKLDFLGTVW